MALITAKHINKSKQHIISVASHKELFTNNLIKKYKLFKTIHKLRMFKTFRIIYYIMAYILHKI